MPRLPGRRGATSALNPWPGYVDALSTLLMVIIFVLLVFVLAQAFLSVALSGRDRALDRLNRQVAELTETVSLERGRRGEMQLATAALNRELQTANAGREQFAHDLAALRDELSRLAAERDVLRADRDRLAARLADAELQGQSALARNEQLQARITEASSHADAAGQETATVAGQLADTRRQLAQARAARDAAQTELTRTVEADHATIAARTADIARLTDQVRDLLAVREELQQQAQQERARATAIDQQRQALQTELNRTVEANRATLAARTADLARLSDQMQAVTASRDQLAERARQQENRAGAVEQQRQAIAAELAEEQRLDAAARAQVAQLNGQITSLNQQVTELRAQLQQVASALDVAEHAGRDKDAQIAALGTRLNAALLSKVEELQRYRSEFFGRLREVLQNRQGVQIVGDRFVFQSEVLFPVGSAELIPSGQEQIRKIAVTLKQIMAEMPADIPWVLRVDGHADRQPVSNSLFASNWELSAQRAINVVKLLTQEGIPPTRLAATGFGEFQPLDGAETPAAYARNRRIELRLTDR